MGRQSRPPLRNRPTRLRTAHLHPLFSPVQVVEPEAGNLAGAQAVGDQHHENGPVADIGRPIAFGGRKQAQDLVPVQSLRDRLAGVKPRRHDAIGKPRHAPAPVFRKAKEGPQVLRVTPDCPPAEAAGMPVRDLAVDIVDADRRQGDSAVIQPVEEIIDRVAGNENRLLGPAPL